MNPPVAASVALAAPTPRVRATRTAAVLFLLALVALGLAWELWLAPLRPGGSWWAIKVLPLLLPLAGLLRYRMLTYRALSLFIWLYVIEGLVRASSDRPPASHLALGQVALCLLLFAACAAHVRWRQRDARDAVTATAHT